MALKKPSELLNTKKESSESFLDKPVQKFVEQPELNSFSEVFDSFKNNLSNIEVLSGKVEEIQEEVKSLLKKEDLERAMVSQLLVLEQSIRDIQSKVKGINESNLESIKEDIATLSSSVNDFIEVEVPKYEKRTVESEFRIGKNFSQLESNVNKSLDVINEFVENKYQELAESLEGINEQSLSGIVEDFKNLENIINEFKTNDIPKYKDFIVTSEKRSETLVDEKLDQFDSKVQDNIDSIDAKVVSEVSALNDKFLELKEEDIPSYKKFIIDTENRTESKLKEFSEDFDSKVEKSNKSISELDEKFLKFKEEDIPSYKKFILETELKSDKNLKEFGEKLDNTTSSILEKVNLIDRDHTDLVDLITSKVTEVNDLTSEVNGLVSTVELSEEKFKKSIEEKISNLEIEVIRNESHLKIQNENLEKVQEDIKLSLTGLSDLVEECDKNNYDLGKKIKYLEEVFTKFDEKELLTEGLLDSPSETNSDPLTPLDQNFVTLDQLQNHYRVFINRIQQQLSTLGGGGETRLEFLDDVDRDTAKVDGKFLKYQSSTGKWVGADASGGAGSQTLDETLGLGNTSSTGMSVGLVTATELHVGVDTGFFTEDLVVNGDARITGILSVGTATITLDPDANTVRIGTGITLNANTNSIEVGGSKIADTSGNAEYSGIITAGTVQIGSATTIHSTGIDLGSGNITSHNVNSTGIITATSFVGPVTGNVTGNLTGNVTGTATTATNLNNQAASYYLDYDNFTNTPTIPTNNNELTNGAGFITSSDDITGTSGGLTGSPSITVTDITAVGNVSITGTLTYEDVTNVDSIGIATARTGLDVLSGGLDITGVSTFKDNIHLLDDDRLQIGGSAGTVDGLEIYHDGSNSYINDTGTGALQVRTSALILRSNVGENMAFAYSNGAVQLYHNNSRKFETTTTGIDVTGLTDTDTLNVSGTSTFAGSLDINSGVDISGDVFIADILGHSGDQNTAIRFPANDTFTVETAGQERIRVDSSGRLGIGTVSPSQMLEIYGSTPTIELTDSDTGVIHRINANSGAGIWYFDNDVNNVGSDGSYVFRHGHANGGGTVLTISPAGTLTLGSGSGTIRRSGDTDTFINMNGNNIVRTYCGGTEILEVNTGGIFVTGTIDGDELTMGDNEKILLGAGDDLQIYHDGSNSYIKEAGTGNVIHEVTDATIEFKKGGSEHLAKFIPDGAVELYHNNNKRLETTSSGIDVYGSYANVKVENSSTAQYAFAGVELKGPAGDERSTKILHGNSNAGGTETYFQIEQNNSSGSYVKTLAQYNYQYDYWSFLTGGTERLKLDYSGITVTGDVTVTAIATAPTFYAESGTYAAGTDTVTDAAIVIEEEGSIYTKDGAYLRKLIEKKSDIINIGQQNTSLVDGIHLKPGTTGGSVKLHAGGSTDNVKLETTASGITVTGDVEITPTNSGGEGGHITLRNPDKTSTGAEIDVSSANTFRIFQLNNNSTMEMGQLSGTGGTILFKTENTERMKIHANGCITKPSHPILKVNSTHTFGAYQSLHANPNVSIAQASAQIDIGDNGWTTSGSNAYTFVCPVTGVYAVHAHISLGDITQGNRVIWSMAYTFGGGNLPLQNYVEVIDTTVSDYQNTSYFDTWYFSAGTRVGMGINTNSGGTITNHGLSWGMYLLQ